MGLSYYVVEKCEKWEYNIFERSEKNMTKEQKRKNFKRIAESRVNEILDKLQSLQNLTNTSFYFYDSEDIEKIFTSIEIELNNTLQVLKGIKKKGFNLYE